MSYINLATKKELSGKALELFKDAEKRWKGYVPNIVRAYALAPKVMVAEDIWSKGVMYDGLLPRTLKEGIATVVSRINECSYCANSHANAYTIAGGKEENAEACILLDFNEFDEKDKIALNFARKATQDKNLIKQEDIDVLKEYYTDSEIVEIAVVIQQFMGYNWFVTILGLELEDTNPFKEKGLMV